MAAERENERVVADPEEFNQTTRLRTLNKVREQVGETIEATMTQLRTDDSFAVEDRQQILRAAVYRYLTEIEWLAQDAGADDVLTGTEFGTVTVHPPERLRRIARGDIGGYPRVIGSPTLEPTHWTISGIVGYLTAPEVFSDTWSLTVEKRHTGPETISESAGTYMPAHVSVNAFRIANRFLNEHGIDIDLAEDQHRAVIDDDVMEEVEQWRKQALD